jgi:regulator of sigma E protease
VQSIAYVALAIAGISVMILFHEFGHFVVARCFRVRVEQFSLGLGREIVGFFDRWGTRWSVGVRPIAGIVRFYGSAASGRAGVAASKHRLTPYDKAKPGIRLLIVLAGPLFSLVFTLFVTASAFYCFSEYAEPVVGSIANGSAAERGGLAPGDRILAIDGNRVISFDDLRESIQNSHAPIRRLTVLRNGQVIAIDVAPISQTLVDGCKIAVAGITANNQRFRYSAIESLASAANLIRSIFVQIIPAMRKATPCLGGISVPIATGPVDGTMRTIALFSFSYAIFNFIPMRTLDGSELIFCLLALICGRPLRQRTEERVGRVMFTSATLLFSVLGVINALR